MIHPCQFRIFSGNCYHFFVNIIPLNIHLDVHIYFAVSFVNCLIPCFFGNQMGVILRQEFSVHARCNAGRHHCCLDWNGSASAKGIYQNPVLIPWCQHNQSGSQVFCDGSLRSELAIPSFMQRFAGCIQANRNHIFHNKDADRESISVFRKPGFMIGLLHTLYHGFLHNGLNIGRTEQFAFYTGSLCHPEFAVSRNKLFPGQRKCPLKQLLKGLRLKTANLYQNSFSRSQKNIRTADGRFVSPKRNASIFHCGYFQTQI